MDRKKLNIYTAHSISWTDANFRELTQLSITIAVVKESANSMSNSNAMITDLFIRKITVKGHAVTVVYL